MLRPSCDLLSSNGEISAAVASFASKLAQNTGVLGCLKKGMSRQSLSRVGSSMVVASCPPKNLCCPYV